MTTSEYREQLAKRNVQQKSTEQHEEVGARTPGWFLHNAICGCVRQQPRIALETGLRCGRCGCVCMCSRCVVCVLCVLCCVCCVVLCCVVLCCVCCVCCVVLCVCVSVSKGVCACVSVLKGCLCVCVQCVCVCLFSSLGLRDTHTQCTHTSTPLPVVSMSDFKGTWLS